MGQKFLEKALLSLKRAMRRANPRCREKMIQNLLINEMVRGQAQRNWITLHINNAADVEPCVFCQLSTDNLGKTSAGKWRCGKGGAESAGQVRGPHVASVRRWH